MGRKKKPVPDDPEQYARFVETAERIQDQDAEKRFEDVMKSISKAKRVKSREDPDSFKR